MKSKFDDRVHKQCKAITEIDPISNLKELLANTRKKYGNENAFIFKTKEEGKFKYLTYNDYIDEIEALGTALINVGLKGKRIAVISENRYEWTLGYLATVTGVGVVVPLDKSLPENELRSSIERSEAEAVIYSKKYEDIMSSLNNNPNNKVKYYISMDKEKSEDGMYSLRELINSGKDLIKNNDRSFIDCKIDNEAMSIMLFT